MNKEYEQIIDLLDDIKSILLLTNNETIQQTKNNLLKDDSEEKKIYELCEGKTTEQIATSINKSNDVVHANLSRLRKKGLIKTIKKNGKKIHEQRF